jgi:secreted trypsin-like serine protease
MLNLLFVTHQIFVFLFRSTNLILSLPGFCAVIAAVLLAVSGSAQAIVIRHDVASAEYEQFASQFKGIATFWGQFQGKSSVEGTGMLIAESWVLTAAHVANVLKPGAKVQIGADVYWVKRCVLHPDWRDQQFANDIALVELTEPTSLKEWPQLYTQPDEQGLVLTFVGRGDTGNGLQGVTTADTKMRAATNQVIQAQGQWLRFSFDQGASALPLEGISGPGDSGGPALVRKDDIWYLVGVSSWQNAEPTQWQEGRYGVIENYSRVSHHLNWIRQTLTTTSPPDNASTQITDVHMNSRL